MTMSIVVTRSMTLSCVVENVDAAVVIVSMVFRVVALMLVMVTSPKVRQSFGFARVAQLVEALGSGPRCWRFESSRGY